MAGTLAHLLKNRLAVALLGAVVVVGAGTTVALAASNGQTATRNTTTQRHANDSNDDHGNDGNDGNNLQGSQNGNARQAEGTITSINTGASSFVLKAGGASMTVVVNSKTIFDDELHSFSNLKAGMAVEVRGNPQSDNSLLATKIEGANDANDAHDADDGVNHDANDDHGGDSTSGRSGSGTSGGSSSGSGRGGHDDGPAHQ